MNSPFVFGSTVSKSAFTNRVSEVEQVTNNILNGINTIIISPRRWGKSSLVEHVVDPIKRKRDYRVVTLDLFSIQREEDFLSEFARLCIRDVSSKWQEWTKAVKGVFKKLVPKLIINSELGDFTLQFDSKEIIKHRQEILDLPETLAKKDGKKLVVCIDEFQNIRNYSGGLQLEKAMRSYWQRHKHVTYCLYGSKRHMMTEIFNDSSNPFYRFGDLMVLDKISKQDWIAFITEKFAETKKSIPENLATLIAEQMDCHSWYVQQLAHRVWIQTKKKATLIQVHQAIEDIKNAQLPFFQFTLEKLSNTQINLLKAVMAGESQYTANEVMKRYKLGTPNNVRKNLKKLSTQDIIDRQGGVYNFLDPIFKSWLITTYQRDIL